MSRTWDGTVQLSEAGEARRGAILRQMEASLRRRVQRRRAARGLGAGLAVVLLAGGAALLLRTPGAAPVPRPGPGPIATAGENASPAGLTMRHATFQVVQTRHIPGLSGGAAAVTTIDDDQLLAELQAMGRPTGIIRTRGTVVLTGNVTGGPDQQDGGQG